MLMRSCFQLFVIFFFKQKTAYEMRISDWSSDVCSSDLKGLRLAALADLSSGRGGGRKRPARRERHRDLLRRPLYAEGRSRGSTRRGSRGKIGRASCRERVCQYV